jgi:DNA modification methylase
MGGDEDAASVHGTQEPVECLRRPIVNNSAPGDAVYEPFCGSGTTIVAAETVGRVCLAMEISPAYCDVAVERWQRFTGRSAVLVGEERVFPDVAAARRSAGTE